MIRRQHPWVFSKGTFESACHRFDSFQIRLEQYEKMLFLSDRKMEDKKLNVSHSKENLPSLHLRSLKIPFENIS